MTDQTRSGQGISRQLLASLHCPYCGSAFDIETTDPDDAAISYGILLCACYEFPIVDGIPILQQIDGLQRVVGSIRDSDRRLALLRALDVFRIRWAKRSRWHRLKYHLNCSRLVSDAGVTFSDAAQLVRRPKVFADYLTHRYANPSFLAAIGPILVLANALTGPGSSGIEKRDDRRARLLDVGCGAGHASFLLQLLSPDVSLVSADQDFVNVYLARRYLVPNGWSFCLDAQVPSPFPDAYFDAVYCQDAFHYMQSKKAAVEELKRTTCPDSLWVFPHLHNRLCDNLVPGIPLSPDGYRQCFDLPGAQLFPESGLLRKLWSTGTIDLSSTDSCLDDSPNLTMIRGSDALWREHRGFPQSFSSRASTLEINPIYRATPVQDGMALERRWPNPVMAQECAEAETVLPTSCHLTRQQIAQLATEDSLQQPAWLEDLVARFVLVPLPPRYKNSSVHGPDRSDASAFDARDSDNRSGES